MTQSKVQFTKARIAAIKPGKSPRMIGDLQMPTLYLRVSPSGARSWIQRIAIHGKRRDIGLGPVDLVTPDEARELAFANRVLVRRGGDPLAEKRKAAMPTFAEAAAQCLDVAAQGWKNGKQRKAWETSMRQYVLPKIGTLRLPAIGQADVLRVILPIYDTAPSQAKIVRQRIRRVLAWAQAKGLLEHNVADERIDAALPKNGSGKAKHHTAIKYVDLPGALRQFDTSGAGLSVRACFRFIVLTACRTAEARGATWAEIDLEARTWTIPAERTKTGQEYRVPLSTAALELLAEVKPLADASGLVFPSPTKKGASLSNAAIRGTLHKCGLAGKMTVHGCRSSFRDWAAESGAPREIAEAALGHTVGGVEGAYFRSDLFERRRRLMQGWADFLGGEAAKVVELHAG